MSKKVVRQQIPHDGVTPVEPTPYIPPQDWQNPVVEPAPGQAVVYPETQEEQAIPYVPAAVPDLVPHVYVPVDPEPVERAPEPEAAIPAAAPPLVIPTIPPHPNSR